MITLTVNGKVFGVETDWSQCTSLTSTNPVPGKYYIDKVEVTKEYFESEYKRIDKESPVDVGYERMIFVDDEV